MTSEPLILSLGWTLLHSLWQLGAIALVLYALLRLLSGHRAESRYLLACTALALCLLAPLATFSYLYQPVVAPQTPNLSPQETMVENQAESAVSGATVQTPASPRPPQSAAESLAITSPATPVTVPQPQLAHLQRLLPYLVIFWLFGVTLLSLKLCLDLIYVSRVRRRSTPVGGGLMQHLESLKRRIGISRAVSLLQTKLCDSPSVIGIFRPVVLLPVSVMTGLSEEQLTAILLHELAHIRRHDYLINLLQSIIETLLFYHPAVWWVSGQIRAEREYACDDMVVRLGSHPVSYARALAELESLRHTPKLAIAASHTNLTERVKRLLGAPQLTPMRGLAGVMILTTLAIMLLLVFPTAAQMDEGEAVTEDLGRLIFVTATESTIISEDIQTLAGFADNEGYLLLEDRQGDEVRRIRVTALESGELDHDYTVNGEAVVFDDEAERWFSQALDNAILQRLREGERPLTRIPFSSHTQIAHDAEYRFISASSFIVDTGLPYTATSLRDFYSGPRSNGVELQALATSVIVTAMHFRAHGLANDHALRVALLAIVTDPDASTLNEQTLVLLRRTADEFDNQDFRADILQRISDLEQQRSDPEASDRRILITASEGIIFSEDYTALEGFLTEADYLLIEDRQPEMTQTVRVSSRAGALIYDYRVNGEADTFDEVAEGWFKETLNYAVLEPFQTMLRETGAAPRRSFVRYEPILASFFVDSTLRQAPSHIRDFYSAI